MHPCLAEKTIIDVNEKLPEVVQSSYIMRAIYDYYYEESFGRFKQSIEKTTSKWPPNLQLVIHGR